MSKQERIDAVNKIIKAISVRGRKFFFHENNVAFIFIKNKLLYMKSEYDGADICLRQKDNNPPRNFYHGGTLWYLVCDFRYFIRTGNKCDGFHNFRRGIINARWNYPESEMQEIIEIAKEVGYL